jgi:nucleotide-binding universal stress UspA family protein
MGQAQDHGVRPNDLTADLRTLEVLLVRGDFGQGGSGSGYCGLMSVAKSIEVTEGILVGHDGSTHSDRALAKAVEIAQGLGVPLTVVRSWTLTTAPRPDSWEPGYMPPLDDFEAATLAALDEDIVTVRLAHPDVNISTAVVHGSAAARLIEASSKVDMIVVGRRGIGGFRGLLLGSVSEQVVRHAESTVVVVHA